MTLNTFLLTISLFLSSPHLLSPSLPSTVSFAGTSLYSRSPPSQIFSRQQSACNEEQAQIEEQATPQEGAVHADFVSHPSAMSAKLPTAWKK